MSKCWSVGLESAGSAGGSPIPPPLNHQAKQINVHPPSGSASGLTIPSSLTGAQSPGLSLGPEHLLPSCLSPSNIPGSTINVWSDLRPRSVLCIWLVGPPPWSLRYIPVPLSLAFIPGQSGTQRSLLSLCCFGDWEADFTRKQEGGVLDTLSFVQLLMDPGPQRTGLDQISTLGVCVGGGPSALVVLKCG